MFNIGPGELLAIAAVALVVLGPQRLPEALRTVGKVVGELRRISGGFQDELRRAIDDSGINDPIEDEDDVPASPAVRSALGEAGAADSDPEPDPDPATADDAPQPMQLPTDLPVDLPTIEPFQPPELLRPDLGLPQPDIDVTPAGPVEGDAGDDDQRAVS